MGYQSQIFSYPYSNKICVPTSERYAAFSILPIDVIIARWPPLRINRAQASILGSMEPTPKLPSRKWDSASSRVIRPRRDSFSSPKCTIAPSTSMEIINRSTPTSSASFALARSLTQHPISGSICKKMQTCGTRII